MHAGFGKDRRRASRPASPRSRRASLLSSRAELVALQQAQKLGQFGHYRWSVPEDRLLSCTQQYRRILGLPDEGSLEDERGLKPLIHPADRARVIAEYRTAEVERRSLQIEFRILRGDGKPRHVRDFTQPEPDAVGQAGGIWFGTLQDITELVEEQQTHRQSEERYRKLVEASFHGIIVCDENGKALFTNQAFATIFGFDSVEEILNLDSLDHLVPPEDFDRIMSYRTARLAGRAAPSSYEARKLRRDGTTIWVENRSVATDWNGKPAVQSIVIDITERKRAEEAMQMQAATLSQARLEEHAREMEAKSGPARLLRALLDHARDSIEIIDPETGRFLDVNEKACLSHGYTREEFLSLTVADLDPAVAAKPWQQTVDETRRAGSLVLESLHRRKDGSTFPVEINAAYVRLDRDYILAVVRDVTERKLAEKVLRDNEQKYRNLVEGSIQGIFVHDEMGKPLFANQAFAAIYGFDSVEEVLAFDTLDHLIPPDELERIMSIRRARLMGEPAPASYVARRLRRDGTMIWLDNRSKLIEWNGRPAIQALVVDVSERMRAEDAMRSSAAALSQAQRLAKVGHYRWSDREQRLISRSDSYLEILGLSEEPATGTEGGVGTVVHPEDRERVLADYRTNDSPERGERIEFRIIRPDGKIAYIRDLSEPEANPNGPAEVWIGTIQDITEIKRAEEDLRRNEERFRSLAEITSDWQWETDEEFRIAGYSGNYDPGPFGGRDSIIGRTLWQIADVEQPDDSDAWAELAALVRNRQPIREYRYSLKGSNGGLLHRRLSGRPLFGADKRFMGYLLASRDVTAEVEADARARSAEELVARSFASISDGIAIYDANDRLTFCNARYRGLFVQSPLDPHGRTFEELVRLDLADGLYVDAIGREEAFVQERLAAHRRSGTPFLYRTSAGLWIQARDDHLPDGSIVAIRTDVTSLVEAEERFLSLANNLPGIVYRRIVQPDGRIREVYVSEGAKRMLGIEPQAFASGRASLLDCVYAEDRERELALLEQSMESMLPLVIESERYTAAGGSLRWWQVHATPRRLADGSTQFDGIALDITERRAAELQLRKAQRLEALGELTSGISHDFNNVLGVIIGSLDFALEAAAGNDQLEDAIRTATRSALQGSNLTKRLLSFSRGQSLSPEAVDLNRHLMPLAQMLRPMLGERISLELRPANGLWECLVDPSRIDDAILNLAINARDAMPEGGRLTIATENVHLDAAKIQGSGPSEPGDFVRLSISDSGIGMPREVLERAFEPFFTTKEPGKGTGLGLSQVYGFVKQSKGHIVLDSEPGHWTTVTVYLPRALPSPAYEEPADRTTTAATGGALILLAEDNERLRRIAVKEINELGFRTLEAGEAAEALALLDAHPEVGLLFSDVVMPGGMSGYDLVREARRRRPDLKVLLTSGFTAKLPHRPRHEAGVVEFLPKPYGKRELASKLMRLLKS